MLPMLPPPLLAAFANPWMLWGLAGASLPIVIHLLNRRRYREVPWAAMRFLLAATRKNQRRVQVEQWLLLAVRTAILALLALALAKPALESLGGLEVFGRRTHWVLALDGSLSMDYRATGDVNRFAQAKALARRLIQDARPGDAFSLVLMADPPRAVVGAPAFSKDAVRKELDALVLPHGGTDLAGSFRVIDEVLEASDIPRKEVVVLTDLQRASWAQDRPGAAERLQRTLARIDAKKARSMVIDLGSADAGNRAVVALDVQPALVTTGSAVAVKAKIQAFGRPFDAARAQLVVDGRIIPAERRDLPALAPGGAAEVEFGHEFAAAGDHVVEVRIDDDPLPLDDRARKVVPVREAIDVLLVDGDPKPGVFTADTAFLAEALSPEGESPGQSGPIRTRVIPDTALARTDLSGFATVVLCNVARVSPDEAGLLDAYLKQGGGLVVFTGDRVEVDSYNRILHDGGKGLLPAALAPAVGDPQRRETPFLFDPLGFKHPIVADYQGASDPVQASLTNVKTFRYHRLTPDADGTATVALKFGPDAAVVEGRHHRGRVLLFATGADRDWTDWPIHPSYPAVVERAVLQAASGRNDERNLRVGQAIDETLPVAAANADVTVTWPDRDEPLPESDVQVARLKAAADGDVARVRFEPTTRSGTYRVEVGPPLGTSTRFAANPDPAESDPAKLDAEALRGAVPGWKFDYDSDWRPLSQNAASVGQRGELHRPMLWALLALLLLEPILAWRFGHPPAPARA